MNWRDIQEVNNSLRETHRLEEETARLKAQQAEMERQAQNARRDEFSRLLDEDIHSGNSDALLAKELQKQSAQNREQIYAENPNLPRAEDMSREELYNINNLTSNGVDFETAYDAVHNKKDNVYVNRSPIDYAKGLAGQVGMGVVREGANALATVGRVTDVLFGEDFKPFNGSVQNFLEETHDEYGKGMEYNKLQSTDKLIVRDKKTGAYKSVDKTGTAGEVAFDIAEATPLILECSVGAPGIALAIESKTGDALKEYKLTEKEENDMWDLACALGKGAVLGITMRLGGKAGQSIGNYVSAKAKDTFAKFVTKYGDKAASKMLSDRIVAFMSSQAGNQAGGLASGEIMMVGDAALSDAIDNVFKGYDKDIWGDMKESFSKGLEFHLGMQAVHGTTRAVPTAKSAFKIRNEYKSWQEASNIYADNLKKNGFTFQGGNDIQTGEYKGRKCFIIGKEGDSLIIKHKDKNNGDKYTEIKVGEEEVKYNPAGKKDVNTFTASELVRFVNPNPPVAIKDKNGNLVYKYTVKEKAKNGRESIKEVIGNVDNTCDGKMFYVYENGKPKLRIYNDTEKAMQEPAEYDYFKKLNEQEELAEPKAEDIAVEQPKAEEGINTPTDEVVTATAPTNGEIKVSDIDKNEFVEVDTENGDEVYTVIRYGNDDYIVPFKSVEESNASGDYTTKAYKIGEKGLEETNLTITEPNKANVFSEESVSKIDGNALREQVGEELEAPKADDNSLKNDNEVKEQDEQTDGTSGDSTDNDSANSGEIPTNGTHAETLEQPQPKVEPTQPQPKAEDLPLVGENDVINTNVDADADTVLNAIAERNGIGEFNSSSLKAVENKIKKQLSSAESEGDIRASHKLKLVLDRISERKGELELNEKLAKQNQKAERDKILEDKKNEDNRKLNNRVKSRTKRTQELIETLEQTQDNAAKALIETAINPVNAVQQARRRGRPKKDKQAEQPQAEVTETPAEQTAPIVEQPIVETPSAETTTEQTTATHVWGDNMKPYLDKFSTADTRRKLANLLSKVRQDETISLEDKEEFGNVVKEKQKSLSPNADSTTQSTRTTNAQREEERVKHLTEVSNDLLNILQSETIENKKEELNNFIEKVNNDSKLSEEDKKQLINDAKRNIDILDGKEPTPPTDGGGKPADEVKTDAVEETAPVETPIDATEATAPKDETTKTSTAKTELELAREEDNAYWAKQTKGFINQGIVEKGKYDSLIAKINEQIANPKESRISVDEAEKKEAYLNKYKEEGYKEKQLQLRNAIEKLKKVLGKDSASKSEVVDEVDVNKELSAAQSIINTQTIDYKDTRTAQQKIDTLEASKAPFVGKKGYERVVKKYDDAIKELKGDAERERVAQEERTEKTNKYKEENKSEDKESSTVRTVTIDKLKKEVPSEKSGAWKRLYADLKGATSVKAIQDVDFKNFIEKFWNNYSGKLESALNKTLFDGNLQMYDKSLEVAEKIGIVKKKAEIENREQSERLKDKNNVATDERTKTSVENEAPKHILTEEQFDAIKKGLEKSGVFKHVKVVGDIIGRYEQICGKEAADAIRNSNGELLGFVTKNGDIFLSKKSLSADTLVHETGHCLFKAFRENGIMTQKAWEEMTMLAERCGVLDELPAVYKHLSKDAQVEEAFVRAIGKKGGIKLQGGLWERFKELAKRQWMVLKSYLGIENAKDELSFNDLADMYADKIVNGKYEAEEKKVLEDTNKGASDSVDEMNKELDDLCKSMSKEDVDSVKLAFNNYGGTGAWDSNAKMQRASNCFIKFLRAHNIEDERAGGLKKLKGEFCRMLLDTYDSVYRLELSLHKRGAYFDGNTDFVERIAQAKSIIMSQQQKLMRGEIKDLDNAYEQIAKLKLTITDTNGNVVPLDKSMVSKYLQCRNAKNGRNDRTYKEIIEKEYKKRFGNAYESIMRSSKGAMFVARQAERAMKSMRTEIDKYELEVTKATTTEEIKKAETKLENAYRRILTNHNFTLKKALDTLNNIRDGLRKAEGYTKDNAPADLQHLSTLGLHRAKYSTLKLKDLRDLFVETENRVNDIRNDIEQKKIQDRLDKFKEDFENEIKKDTTRTPQTEWLHKEWIPKNPGKCVIYEEFKKDLNDAIEQGLVQKYKTDGCGVSTADATKFCAEFESKVSKELVDKLSTATHAITDFTLKKSREGELITEQEFNELSARNKAEDYVPLRGFKYDPKKAESDFTNSLINDTSGADRSVVTAAEGRISESDDPYKSMINMASSSIASAQTNICQAHFYKLLVDCDAKQGKQANFKGELKDLATVGKWYKKDANGDWKLTKDAPVDTANFEDGVYKSNGEEYIWKNGDVKEFAQGFNMKLDKARAHAVNLCLDGNKVQMVFKDKSVADAFNQTNKKLCDTSVAGMWHGYFKRAFDFRKKINNIQSKWLTSWTVRFAIANHERDVATYAFRLAGSGYEGVSGSFFSSYRDIFKFLIGKDTKDMEIDVKGQKIKLETLLNDWGLATGYVEQVREGDVADLEKRIDKIRNAPAERYKMENGHYTNERIKDFDLDDVIDKLMDKRPQAIKDTIEELGKLLSKANEKSPIPADIIPRFAEALELVPRLAAFKVALKNGADINQAVQFGKNITANFNRNGDFKYHSLGKYIYASVPFFNAGMQGLKMAFDMTQQNPKRIGYSMFGMLAFGLIANEFERWFYGNNEFGKPKATTIDDYNRGSSIRIPIGEDVYQPIYMPHYFRSPLDFAMNVSDCLHGERTWNETFWGCIGSLADVTHFDFSKLGEGWSGVARVGTQFAPMEVKIATDLFLNENFFGSQIYKEPFDKDSNTDPEWTLTIGNGTYPILIDACRILNELGGGTDNYAAGSFHIESDGSVVTNKDKDMVSIFDRNPQALQYIISQFLPITQMADYGYRGYQKALKEEDAENFLIPRTILSTLQLDKLFGKSFTDSTISAGQLAKGAKKGMQIMKSLAKNKDIPKTEKMRKMMITYGKVEKILQDEKKVRKAVAILEANGETAKAKERSRYHDNLMFEAAKLLYELQSYDQLDETQRMAKDWIERIEGYKE